MWQMNRTFIVISAVDKLEFLFLYGVSFPFGQMGSRVAELHCKT